MAIPNVASPVAAAPTSQLFVDSEPGDSYLRGQADYLTSDDATFFAAVAPWLPSIQVQGPDHSWQIGASDDGGGRLVAGQTYTGASLTNLAGSPNLWVFGGPRGSCTDGVGQFTVHDVGYYGSAFSRLSMSFELTCNGATGKLRGELRYRTTAPDFEGVLLSPVKNFAFEFEPTVVGQTSPAKTFTLHNVGASGAPVGTIDTSGSDPAQLEIVNDACSDTTVSSGGECSFDVRYAPSAPGSHSADIDIPLSAPHADRHIRFEGSARLGTTTTIDPVSGWLDSPVTLTARVTPDPTTAGPYMVDFVLADYGILGSASVLTGGTASATVEVPPGIHDVHASFFGYDQLLGSQSAPTRLMVRQDTLISLTTTEAVAQSSDPPTVTVMLEPVDFDYGGGQLILEDLTDGSVIESMEVARGQTSMTVEPFLTNGVHELQARYTGTTGVADSTARLTQEMRISADATFSRSSFFPHPDGYRDTLKVSGWRGSNVSVEISVRHDGQADPVRTFWIRPDPGVYGWTWDGRDGDGVLVPGGVYEVTVAFIDGGADPRRITKDITVDRRKVTWKSKSVTVAGNRYNLTARYRNGSVSTIASDYARGARIASGEGSMTVGYALPVVRADTYGWLKLQVRGRSTNGHKALVAIWNPSLGGYRGLANYDAAKLIGPGYRWWNTVANGDGRVRTGKVRGIVAVAKGMGKSGPAVFDINSVKLTYEAGTFSGTATAGPAVVTEDIAVAARRGQTAPAFFGSMPLPSLASPSVESAAAATSDSAFAFESQYGVGGMEAGFLSTPAYSFSSVTEGSIPTLYVSGQEGTWRINAAGIDGAQLVAGQTYSGALDQGTSSTKPYLRMRWDAQCSGNTYGQQARDFVVHDVAYAPDGNLERLSMSITQRNQMTAELRFNTDAPAFPAIHQTPFCLSSQDRYPATDVGEASAPVDQTLTSMGATVVALGPVGLVGMSDDFEIVTDDCSDVTLASGASCSIATRFTPTGVGYRNAAVGISTDYGTGARMIDQFGMGMQATSLTLEGPSAEALSPVPLRVTVSPDPFTQGTSYPDVTFVVENDRTLDYTTGYGWEPVLDVEMPLPPGRHHIHAEFEGNHGYHPSTSNSITVDVAGEVTTTIDFSTSDAEVPPFVSPTLTAVLSPTGQVTGGELEIYYYSPKPYHPKVVLGRQAVTPTTQSLEVRPSIAEPGTHKIYAHFTGYERFLESWGTLDQVVVDDTVVQVSAKVQPLTMYPVVDGFRDAMTAVVKRGEPAALRLSIVSGTDGPTLHEASAPLGSSEQEFTWDGTAPGGELAAPGYYTLRIRATDAAGNHKNIQRQLVLSHDWVEWTTRTVTKDGKAFQLKGTTRDGVVQRPSPRYSNGVRLLSNSGSASVVYAFPVVAADAYRSMTFQVRGKSANGHKAVISIWNPDLGAYKYLGTYDAAVAIGPSYATWQTTADGAARVVNGTVRGAVSTWAGLGKSGKSIFDVSNVTFVYESGTLVRAATVAAANGASADLLADYIADAPRGLQGRTARSLLPFRYGPTLRWTSPPTEPTEPEVTELKLRLFPKTVAAVVGARKVVSAWTCPAEDRSPWGPDRTPGTGDDDCDPVVADWALDDPEHARLNKTTSHKVLVQMTSLVDNRLVATDGELKRPALLTAMPRTSGKPMPPLLGEEPEVGE